MNKNFIIFLIIIWVILKVTKKMINYDGKSRYNFIQLNTIGYWLLINTSLFLSKKKFRNFNYTPVFFVLLLFIHESLYYGLPYINIQLYNITKDESEITNNCYNWFNIYCSFIKNEKKSDLSEGIFNNNWNLSNIESIKLKYDTYYKYLKLKPGMKLFDIGCGNCHWLSYCKSRGIKCYGLTICKSQADFCNSKGMNIILGDIHKDILRTIKDKFDAISAIGPAEHFSTVSQTPENSFKILNSYYSQVKNLIDPNSNSRRYLNSIMTLNKNYSKKQTLKYYANFYFIIGTFGYGSYPYSNNIEKIYNSKNSKVIIKRDYTEDYRWASGKLKSSLGYCNYELNTPYKILNFFKDILIDPLWWQRFCYGYFNCWMWQFGGTNPKPMPENKDTPIRSYIYVTEINK